jgi:eukaryotic-like serine/threonine-protein kinase
LTEAPNSPSGASGVRIKDLDPAEARHVAALLDEAMTLEPTQRVAWQAELARREPQLCGLVGGMARAVAAPDASLEGRHFGAYRVLRLLGQGGMGSVWLAERADGLFERQVALKLLHASFAGGALRERFARERSILGALDHPLIAKMLDAGVAPDGQPYLAIEYVEGSSLTAHCDNQRLALNARIALMTQVLAAVQYAHQNLVIHRDLKPANILVTPEGQVRLLDFGIAKLMTDDGQARETELTQLGGRALTPDYASPEQIAGRPVSTASDVYSLGVVLYVLLCGQPPYRLPRDSRAALEQAIVATPPVRPSQQSLTDAIADARSTTSRKLAHALAGDLDTIVLKAIKKHPAERYATADAMRQDLQRYLGGEPVLARPDSVAYRFAKFVGRHRLQVGLGTAIGVMLFAAAGVSIWQGQAARAQRTVAERETQRAQAVQAFLLSIFKANSDQQPDPIRARQTTARELLDLGAGRAAESLKGSPQAQDEVLDTLADMYAQLRLHDDAARMRRQRIDALKQAFGANDARVADALLSYANDVSGTHQRDQAEPAIAQAAQILDRIDDRTSATRGWVSIESANVQQYLSIGAMRKHADTAVAHFRAHPARWNDLFHALQASARARYLAGDFEGAQARHRDALDAVERHVGAGSVWAINPLVHLAEAQVGAFQLTEAEANFRAALALSLRVNGELSGVTLQDQAKLGGFLHSTGRRDEGNRLMEDTLATLGQKDANATPNAVSELRRARGLAQFNEGRIAEAEQTFATEVEDLRAHYPASLPLSRALLLQAAAFTALGRFEASRAALDEAWRLWQAVAGDAVEPALHNRYRLEQAQLQLALGNADAAEEALRAIAPTREAQAPAPAPAPAQALRRDETQAQLALARARLLQGRASDAQQLAQQALGHLQASPLRERYPRLEADAALRLGQARRLAGNPGLARADLERALVLREATDARDSPWLAETRIALADCLIDLGERKAARAHLNQARTALAAHAELAGHFGSALRQATQRLTG